MSTIGGQDFTNFQAVNVRGSTALRLQVGSAAATFRAELSEGVDRAYSFPNKSGTFPIMGTFRVQFPAAVAAAFSTIITVSGIRAEDALVAQLNGVGASGLTYGFASSTGYVMVQAIPGNGQITLQMQNLGNATAYVDLTGSYLAMR